jgi:hypothetical protein
MHAHAPDAIGVQFEGPPNLLHDLARLSHASADRQEQRNKKKKKKKKEDVLTLAGPHAPL